MNLKQSLEARNQFFQTRPKRTRRKFGSRNKPPPRTVFNYKSKKRLYANRLKDMTSLDDVMAKLKGLRSARKKHLLRNAAMHPVVRVGKRDKLVYAAKHQAALDNFDKAIKGDGTTRRDKFQHWTKQALCLHDIAKAEGKKFMLLPKKGSDDFGKDFCKGLEGVVPTKKSKAKKQAVQPVANKMTLRSKAKK